MEIKYTTARDIETKSLLPAATAATAMGLVIFTWSFPVSDDPEGFGEQLAQKDGGTQPPARRTGPPLGAAAAHRGCSRENKGTNLHTHFTQDAEAVRSESPFQGDRCGNS